MKKFITALLLTILIFSATPAFSQGEAPPETLPELSHQDIRFEHITRSDGLSHSGVYTIVQDQTGFLWIGTVDGLNRFDGYDFEIYKPDPDNPNSIADRTVRALLVDQVGNIWIATPLGGLNKFDPDTQTFTAYKHDPNDPSSLTPGPVFSLFEDRSGSIWIGTEQGLNNLDPISGEITRYQHNPDDPNSISHNAVWGMFEDDDGLMWFGTQGGGLNSLDPQSGKFTHYTHDPGNPNGLCDDRVWTIVEDDYGILWLGTQGGLNSFDPRSGKTSCYRHDPKDSKSLGNDLVKAIKEDSQGVLWVGTWGGGLNILDRETGEFIRYKHDPLKPTSLANDKIASVFEDEEGILWVGTWGGGLNKFDRAQQRFIRIQHEPNNPNSLNNNIVYSTFANDNDEIWIGTVNALNKYNPVKDLFTHYLPDPDNPNAISVGEGILPVFEDSQGILWAGAWAEGLNRFDKNSGYFIHYRHDSDDPNSISSDVILSIYEDSNGVLWLGTLNGGLNKFDRQMDRFMAYRHNPEDINSLSEDHIHVIFEDQSGDLWLGTGTGGLNWFDPDIERFLHFRHDPNDPQSLSADRINAIHQDTSGVLWVGTPNGLNKLTFISGDIPQEIVITRYNKKHGLPSDAIQGILEDDQGYLWLSTSLGLARLDPTTGSIKTFTTAHGLSSDEFFEGAAVRLGSGEMLFGSSGGLTLFDPINIIDNPYIPPVAITDLKILNQSVGVGGDSPLQTSTWETDDLLLDYQDKVITFEFSAFSFANSPGNSYQYMLEGFDDDWSPPSTDRSATYTNLDPGDYVFRVRGSNSDGVWNEEGVSLNITITPPWWDTTWFRGLVLVVLVGLAFGAYHWRVSILQTRSRELEVEVASKTEDLLEEIKEREVTEARLRKTRDELSTLMKLSEDMVSTLDLDPLLVLVLDQLQRVVDYDGAAILALKEGHLVFQTYQGLPITADLMGLSIPVEGISQFRQVLDERQPFIVDDIYLEPKLAQEIRESTGFGIEALFGNGHSWIGIPMTVGDKVIGLLTFVNQEPGIYQVEDLNLAQSFANQAAIALENAQLFAQVQTVVVTEERNRLARDLHDSTTQALYSALLFSETGKKLTQKGDQEGAEYYQSRVSAVIQQALKEMRLLVYELRPMVLDQEGLATALQMRLDAVESRSGIEARMYADYLPQLPARMSGSLYFIAQEALNNSLKHAQAEKVTVNMRVEDKMLTIEVVDDGQGFNLEEAVDGGGMGLINMRERTNEMGGDLTIDSKPGEGTKVVVRIELEAAE